MQERRCEAAERLGEVGVVAELGAVQQAGGDVELGSVSVRGIEDGEVVVHFLSEGGDGQAVAVERGRVGADGSATPEFPVQDPEGVEEVCPVEVAVNGFPPLNTDIDVVTEGSMHTEVDFVLVGAEAFGGGGGQVAQSIVETVPPAIGRVEARPGCVGG